MYTYVFGLRIVYSCGALYRACALSLHIRTCIYDGMSLKTTPHTRSQFANKQSGEARGAFTSDFAVYVHEPNVYTHTSKC